MYAIWSCILVLILSEVSIGKCPHEKSGLKKWSKPRNWPDEKMPGENENVVISENYLVDTEDIPEFFSLTITAKLVLSPDVKHNIRAHYIHIHSGGELIIGAEDCKFTGEATITLLGEPSEKLDVPDFGEKFIGVGPGGTLELHGEKTLTWTKLIETANKFDPNVGLKFSHRQEPDILNDQGAYLYHFTPDGAKVNSMYAKVNQNKQTKIDDVILEADLFIEGIPAGDVFVLVTQREVKGENSLEALFRVLDRLIGGETLLEGIAENAAYALIVVKGSPESAKQNLQLFDASKGLSYTEAKVSLVLYDHKTEFVAIAHNEETERKSFTDVDTFDTDYSRPIIKVHDDVSSWATGDKIFITSTDYKWTQVEEFKREICTTCAPNEIRLDGPLLYTHFGQIHKNVDMRAEVGVMTHNIRIQGEVTAGNSNGGHMKFIKHFESVHIEGVELTNMGQPLVLGRYPAHFHMCEDLADTTLYKTRVYIRYNSFHHNQFRCLTIHGTQNLAVTGNVCYDSYGHGYFLEDGGEKHIHLYGNLGLGQRIWEGDIELHKTGAIPTDDEPATFWITNPLVTVEHNVAAGGDGAGFWFSYPNEPTGPSREKKWYAYLEARHTKITLFRSNVAHSNYKAGLWVDNHIDDDLTLVAYNKYDPKVVPTDPDSESISAYFERFTGFKNILQNVWIRGEKMVMSDCSLSDSLVGAQIIRQWELYQRFENCVVLGDSINAGEPEEVKLLDGTKVQWHRSNPLPNKMYTPRMGYSFNKGPNYLENVYFDDFKSTEHYFASALGFKNCSESFFNTRGQTKNIKFGFEDPSEGNRVFDSDEKHGKGCSLDGDILKNFRDIDGSVTGVQNSQVLRPIPFQVTDKCSKRDNWNNAYCTDRYGTVDFWYKDEENTVTMMRTDEPYEKDTVDEHMATHFLVILGGSHDYLAYMEKPLPDVVKITGQDVTKAHYVRVGFCIPRDADFTTKYTIGEEKKDTTEVHTLKEVDDDLDGGKYFVDKTVGVIFFKLIHEIEFEDDEKYTCPRNECVMFTINIKSGNMDDTNCSDRFKQNQDYIKSSTGNPSVDTRVLPATASYPAEGLGAGSTYPFNNV